MFIPSKAGPQVQLPLKSLAQFMWEMPKSHLFHPALLLLSAAQLPDQDMPDW